MPKAVVLTDRELAVVQGIVRGETYSVIAVGLGLGLETVRTHAANIRSKLGVSSRSAVAAWAVRNGRCD